MAGTETTPFAGDTNLTTEGTLDWAHWGYNNDAAGFNTRETPGAPRVIVQGAGFQFHDLGSGERHHLRPGRRQRNLDLIKTGDARWAGTTTTPSGGLALRADDGNQNPVSGFITYTIDVVQPGTYKLYVRRKVDGAAATTASSSHRRSTRAGAGGVGQAQWDNQTFSPNEYVWTASDGLTPPATTANNPVTYTIAAPGRYTLALGIREANYVIDRVALVDVERKCRGATGRTGQLRRPLRFPRSGGADHELHRHRHGPGAGHRRGGQDLYVVQRHAELPA